MKKMRVNEATPGALAAAWNAWNAWNDELEQYSQDYNAEKV